MVSERQVAPWAPRARAGWTRQTDGQTTVVWGAGRKASRKTDRQKSHRTAPVRMRWEAAERIGWCAPRWPVEGSRKGSGPAASSRPKAREGCGAFHVSHMDVTTVRTGDLVPNSINYQAGSPPPPPLRRVCGRKKDLKEQCSKIFMRVCTHALYFMSFFQEAATRSGRVENRRTSRTDRHSRISPRDLDSNEQQWHLRGVVVQAVWRVRVVVLQLLLP
jgi:hypothetical protein